MSEDMKHFLLRWNEELEHFLKTLQSSFNLTRKDYRAIYWKADCFSLMRKHAKINEF